MKCSRCQHENASEARYCNACGVSLNLTCPSCGQGNAPGSVFCNQCGHALSASDAAASAQRFVSPESYTPKHLAEKILTSKAALEGERKQVTVLFATHPDRFDAETGEAHYRKALALAEPRGMRPLVAHCHLGLGKLYARTDKREQAREHLTTATTMYREMDMRFWLEQAEAELRQ